VILYHAFLFSPFSVLVIPPLSKSKMMSRVSTRCLTAAARNAVGASRLMGVRWVSQTQQGGSATASRDVCDRAAADHRQLEDLFRQMRKRGSDRAALLQQFANLVVSHNDAEEHHFYNHIKPFQQGAKVSGEKAVAIEETEHTHGLMALQAVMEEKDIQSKAWEDKLTVLVLGIMKHINDEEQQIHNLARANLSAEQRARMGDEFEAGKQQRMQANMGSLDNVRKLVKERAGLLTKAMGAAKQAMASV